MNILIRKKLEIIVKSLKGKVGWTTTCPRRVKNLKLLSTAVETIPSPCEKAD